MANVERGKKTKKAIFIVMALPLIIYLINSAYAKYLTERTANGKVEIAKWAVVITADDGTTLDSTTQDITFTVQSIKSVKCTPFFSILLLIIINCILRFANLTFASFSHSSTIASSFFS